MARLDLAPRVAAEGEPPCVVQSGPAVKEQPVVNAVEDDGGGGPRPRRQRGRRKLAPRRRVRKREPPYRTVRTHQLDLIACGIVYDAAAQIGGRRAGGGKPA